jgi:hypothetical protein
MQRPKSHTYRPGYLIRNSDFKRASNTFNEVSRLPNKLQNQQHVQQDLLGQVSRLRKREGQKYVNFYGKS